MSVLLVNNAVSKLAASVAADALVLSVSAGDGGKFPSPTGSDWFPLTLVRADGVREIVRCTGRTGDVLTVTRAQEGTAAVPLASGDRVEVRLTAGALNSLFGGPAALPTFGGMELSEATPYIDFHAGNSADDFTSRIIAEAAAVLVFRSAAKQQVRITDSGLTVFGALGVIGGAGFGALVERAGSGPVSFNAYRNNSNINSFYQAQNTSGSVFFGNTDGATFTINGEASFSSAWGWFRNGSAAVNGSFKAGGNITTDSGIVAVGGIKGVSLTSEGSVYSGNGASRLTTDGNLQGNAWGGFLTDYLNNTYTRRTNLGSDIANYASNTGGIGTYALMTNRSGGALAAGQLVGGASLTYANTEDSVRNGGAASGTWRCMGTAAASASDQGTTLFLRIA